MGVKLTELEAEFVQRTQGGSYRRVADIHQANGVRFACPLCYLANGTLVGTHVILCWDPSVPAGISPGPGRWQLTGSGLSDLTLVAGSSSVKLEGGCRWHGHVRNGECVCDLDAQRVAETQRYWQEQRRMFRQQSENRSMNTEATAAAADAPPLPEVEVTAQKEAAPEPAQPSTETHTPTNIFRWINGELHQAFESIHPGGGPPRMVKVPGTATPPGLLANVEQLVEAKVADLGKRVESGMADVQSQVTPAVQRGIAEAMKAFEARLQALEHPMPAPSPQPAS